MLGTSLYWLGQDAAASPLLEQVADPTRPPDSNLASVWALGCLGAIAARRGDIDSCDRRLLQASRLAAAHDLDGHWTTATAVTTSAERLADRGRLLEAREAALQALTIARRVRGRPETAHALLCLARISARAGDVADARARTREAGDVIANCADSGMLAALLSEAEQWSGPLPGQPLSASGHASRGGGDRRPDGLTPRESEVLDLLADGLANSEIAARLVLSVYTVERHLQHAYRKIGARNRADATAYVVRRRT
jgi:ATP/maltotriose-dependent transcriptional regulator MalT